jgi:hypothetical protein
MSDVYVNLYTDKTIEYKFFEWAQDALDKADNQLDLDIDYSNIPYSVDVTSSKWWRGPNLDDAINDMVDFKPDPRDNSYNMILVDQVYAASGQGKTKATVNGAANGYPYDNSAACAGAVNKAAKVWADNSGCYGGEGTTTFKATVMHNLGHGIISDYSLCNTSDHHCKGEIVGQEVDPMQMGYTAAPCSGNSPPDFNCSDNPKSIVTGISTDYSSCAKDAINNINEL